MAALGRLVHRHGAAVAHPRAADGANVAVPLIGPIGVTVSFPFPTPYPKLLNDSAPLTSALSVAMTEARTRFPALRTAIAIAAVDESSFPMSFTFSGDGHTDTHYSGSLLKVAAMYAAYELLHSADVQARASGLTDPNAVFAHVAATFDPTIVAAVPLIPAAQCKPPDYRKIFSTIELIDGGRGWCSTPTSRRTCAR